MAGRSDHKTTQPGYRVVTRCHGFSLVELMVALAIGVVILGGLVAIHEQSRRLSGKAESVAELADTGRFALSYIAADLRHAGFYGLVGAADLIDGAAGPAAPVAIAVGGDCGRNWSTNLYSPVEGRNNRYDLECPSYKGSARPGSDVLVIRRAASRTGTPESGRLQLHSGLGYGSLNDTGSVPAITPVETRNLIVSAYYVSSVSSLGNGIPGLRRKILRVGPRIVDEEIIPGVEDIQIQFAIVVDTPDPPGDDQSLSWVNPDSPLLSSGESADAPIIVAVRLWLLLSSNDVPLEYHIPIRAYADQSAPPEDDHRRMLIARTFAIRNGGMR